MACIVLHILGIGEYLVFVEERVEERKGGKLELVIFPFHQSHGKENILNIHLINFYKILLLTSCVFSLYVKDLYDFFIPTFGGDFKVI